MPTLLAIEDDQAILQMYRIAFEGTGVAVETAASAAEGLDKFGKQHPDVVLLDMHLPDLSGLETFSRLHALNPKIPIIFITGRGTMDTAIQAMRLGAYDYLLKPLELNKLREVLDRAFEVGRLMRVPAVLEDEQPEGGSSEILIGRCPAMQEVYKGIGRVAPQDVTALILGESGTGKELVARAIYHYSRRSSRPFLAINCAAIPEALLESELFGHEKGAFTGALQRKVGKFEQCSGGTLFLDEIGDMTPISQGKVLRVLQEQQFERVGSSESIRTDVRLIAATNRNLEQMARSGQFRPDLYYRLNVYALRLPPLREREGDLPLLVEHFLKRFRREFGKEVHSVAPETLDLLRRYPWPGNVRELQSTLKRALLEATGPVLLPEFLPSSVLSQDKSSVGGQVRGHLYADWMQFVEGRLQAGSDNLYAEWQALTDRELFTRVLQHAGGNLSRAAKILGIHRGTLRSKIDSLGISVADTNPAASNSSEDV